MGLGGPSEGDRGSLWLTLGTRTLMVDTQGILFSVSFPGGCHFGTKSHDATRETNQASCCRKWLMQDWKAGSGGQYRNRGQQGKAPTAQQDGQSKEVE